MSEYEQDNQDKHKTLWLAVRQGFLLIANAIGKAYGLKDKQ